MRITWIVLGMVFLLIWFKCREEQAEERHRFRVQELEHRIGELEERLCPCQSHEWKRVDYDFVGGTGRGDETTVYTYPCSRCGKVKRTYKLLS